MYFMILFYKMPDLGDGGADQRDDQGEEEQAGAAYQGAAQRARRVRDARGGTRGEEGAL